jgi:predicted PurR-regulated permease PerM
VSRNARDVLLAGLFALAVLYTLFFARAFLLPVAMAVLLALILSPAVGALARLRIPMPLAAGTVVALMLLVIGTAIYRLAAPAADWVKKAPEALGQLEERLRPVKMGVGQVTKTAEKIERAVSPAESSAPAAKAAPPAGSSLAARVAAVTQQFAVSALATVVLLFFLLASGDMFLQKLVRVMPTLKDKKKAVEVARTIQSRMATYLFTITLINTVVAIVVSAVLWMLGMPNPVLWGVMAGLLNYIPVLGPATAAVVFSAVAALSFDSLGEAVRVPAAYLVLHLLEGQVISPFLTGRKLSLNPVVIFLGVLFWGWLWGILGALMAVPILMAVKIVCDNVESLSSVSEFLSGRQSDTTPEKASIQPASAE